MDGTELLGYIKVRKQIYLPAYRWVLEHKAQDIVERLREASRSKTNVLLDYNTNCDVDDNSARSNTVGSSPPLTAHRA